MRNNSVSILFILFMPLLLTSCISGALTGARLFYDRHEISQQVNNYKIVHEANHLLQKNRGLLAGSRVAVASFNYEMLLVGQVKSEAVRQQIVALMRQVNGVTVIYNYLTVEPPISLAQQTHDSWLTTKVISKLVANNNIDPDEFKIVTENAVVYLMGHVKTKQANIAVNLARHTDGVKKVVKLLRYITLT